MRDETVKFLSSSFIPHPSSFFAARRRYVFCINSASSSMSGLSHKMRPLAPMSISAWKNYLYFKSDSLSGKCFFSPFGPYSIPDRWTCKVESPR
jgi:hypothetical protein